MTMNCPSCRRNDGFHEADCPIQLRRILAEPKKVEKGKAMTNEYRHKHADLIHELVEDTRLRVREVGTQGPLLRFADVNFDSTGEIEIVRPDPHAEMRAKFEAEPERYRCYFRKAGSNHSWEPVKQSDGSPYWTRGIEYMLEEIPHWELQKKLRDEPGKWDVEFYSQVGIGWVPIVNPDWLADYEYRLVLKRKMLTIIGVDGKAYEFPEPMREAPEEYSQYWYIYGINAYPLSWRGFPNEKVMLFTGNVHRTREDAIACRNAWILARGGKLPEGEE